MQGKITNKYLIPSDIMFVERTDSIYIINMDDDERVFMLKGDLGQLYVSIENHEDSNLLEVFELVLERKPTEAEYEHLENFITQFCKLGLLSLRE